ncbi:MAG: Caffeyl-CoA reductase-Etf complex subunit CarD [Chloroflexi bacterium]|nr:Caffeyl-CoA reductase-Etf complex subunit CarD [Chloroflexota bacterium]
MNIIVCMKQVVDLEQIRIKTQTREPVMEGLPVMFGDFDKCALEEAVRLKEEHGGKVTAVAAGSAKLKDTIKEALAIGADEAIILTDEAYQGSDTMGSARLLAQVIQKIGDYDLILMGDGSADDYSGEVPPRVAEILDLPQAGFAREIKVVDDALHVTRDLEAAHETIALELPALVSVSTEINTPPLPALTDILKAGRKPLHTWAPDEVGVPDKAGLDPAQIGTNASVVEVLSNLAPVQDRKEIIFEDVEEGLAEITKALESEGVLEQ